MCKIHQIKPVTNQVQKGKSVIESGKQKQCMRTLNIPHKQNTYRPHQKPSSGTQTLAMLNPLLSCFGQLDHEQSQVSQFSHSSIHVSKEPKEEPFDDVHS